MLLAGSIDRGQTRAVGWSILLLIYYNITRIDKAENRSIEEWQLTSGKQDARGPRRARAKARTGSVQHGRGDDEKGAGWRC